ncbi:MAG: enoyl-CoA hydratase/isomerase family protein [Actinomycetota bacterium]|nr:enoyl-CoA hydratase/isomerase family protein [Actinomycetota bacterium]
MTGSIGNSAQLELPGGDLSHLAARALADAADNLHEARDVRVVVLTARTSPFCSGPGTDLDVRQVDPAAALAALRPPLVVAVRGECVSVGLELVLCADIRFCSPDATFAFPDIAAGRLPSWGGTQRLPRAVRPATATAMLLTGQSLDALSAKHLGLVFDVVDDPEQAAADMAILLAGLGPLALEFAKEAVHRGSELPLRDGLRLEGDLNHQLAATEDRAEGLRAFFDKRPPDFSGR